MFDARVLNALIASPGDTLSARDLIERAIYSWNSDRARSAGVVVLPRRWETDAVPMLGGEDGQSVINRQLVDECDLLFGVFHSRLGKTTNRGQSGTAEEIERSDDAGKPVHVYFADMPHPAGVDPEELARLNKFRGDMETRGLFGTFVSLEDLASKVRTAIEHDLEHLNRRMPLRDVPSSGTVRLRARYESDREQYTDGRGRIKHRTRGERLVVRNAGSSTAHHIGVEISPIGEGDAPQVHGVEDVRPDLLPEAEWRYPLLVHMGVAAAWNVHMTWDDDAGNPHEETQPLSWL